VNLDIGSFDLDNALQSQGLTPKPWTQVLETVKAKLPAADWETFSRLHKNFVGYRSEGTLSRFYGFVFSQNLQMDVNAYRYGRLKSVLTDLIAEIPAGITILDIGAGAGIVSTVVQKSLSPRFLALQDLCREVRDELTAQGFRVLPHPAPARPSEWNAAAAQGAAPNGFDLLLCVDSLGEVNADDDGTLAKPDEVPSADLPDMVEERYGFTQKLAPWIPWMAPGGRILLWEPIASTKVFEALAISLRNKGWAVELRSRAPGRNYLELRRN
jgi:hypothetical protein